MIRSALVLIFIWFAFFVSPLAKASGINRCEAQFAPAHNGDTGFVLDSKATMAKFVEDASKEKGLKVLWWNIANGSLSSVGHRNFLAENLEAFLKTGASPDIMMLGEYSDHALDEATKRRLEHVYPHRVYLPYSELQPELGIMFFSKKGFLRGREKVLDWLPENESPETVADYKSKWAEGLGPTADAFYTRTVREIYVNTPKGPIALVPVHLAQPWRSIRTRKGAAKGAVESAAEMFLGSNNPLVNQARDLAKWFNVDPAARRIVIGDFNTPRTVFAVATSVSRALSKSLRPVNAGPQSTFPTPSSPLHGKYPSVQIDHAFTSGHVQTNFARILPLKGSDHFPVYSIYE